MRTVRVYISVTHQPYFYVSYFIYVVNPMHIAVCTGKVLYSIAINFSVLLIKMYGT